MFLDAEHFFDGYGADPAYAVECVRAAAESGAEVIALCDTNGGMLPSQVADVVHEVIGATGARIGIHCHNDTGCAVANSMAAVDAGATHVQGTINGYGERTGNANILTVVSNLQIKQGCELISPDRLREATRIAHAISEVTNVPPTAASRTSGQRVRPQGGPARQRPQGRPGPLPAHRPAAVGNAMRMLVSDMAGRASIELKARELGIDLSDEPQPRRRRAAPRSRTSSFVAAPSTLPTPRSSCCCAASSDRLAAATSTSSRGGSSPTPASTRRRSPRRPSSSSRAGARQVATGEGNGPVNALDHALRQALAARHPELDQMELVDFRVRILEASHGTDAITRVLIETADAATTWQTVGVAANIVEASWRALVDGITYGLVRQGVEVR